MSVVLQADTGLVKLFGKQVGNQGIIRPRCMLIAELGLNHQGDPELARQMIAAAAAAGVDAVKLQRRHLASTYQQRVFAEPSSMPVNLVHYLPILEKCELPERAYPDLKMQAEALGLGFLVTPWDEPSVDFLEQLGVEAYKISSADCGNVFLHAKIARTGKPVIASTGMTSEAELFKTVSRLKASFPDRLVLLHAVSSYPAAFKDCQLNLILRYKLNHAVPVGWSGHERGVTVSVAAAALGADIIERHFTLDRTLPGPDQAASLEPEGLTRLVQRVRAMEEAYGDPFAMKELTRGEEASKEVLGKSIVARRSIRAGVPIVLDDLEAKSPGRGIPPSCIDKLIGRCLAEPIDAGQPISFAMLKEPSCA